jgi:gamma-glutamyltranspeptidase / glutathione hydrolase
MNLRSRRLDGVGVRVSIGMVASPHPTASEAGLSVLQAGGNAIDAAVATAFTLCVVTPGSTGIAGYGGCLLAYLADRQAPLAIDFTSTAPAAARSDMYRIIARGEGAFDVADGENVFGARAVDTPGVVAGLVMAHRHGRLPLTTVMEPAVAAAADGFSIDEYTIQRIAEAVVPHRKRFPEVFRLFTLNGQLPRAGDRVRNSELAPVLERIGREGADAFYHGDVARAVVDVVRQSGGLLTPDDLAAYRAREHALISTPYRNAIIHTPGLPTGGITALQMLRVLETLPAATLRSDQEMAHAFAEINKVCWRQRLTRHGDPDYVAVDPTTELGDSLIARLGDVAAAGMKAPAAGELIMADPAVSTVHICTADRQGNVVSLTQTHGGSFGSLVAVPGTGIVLGHGMSRFDPRPDRANSIAPGKRPLHNMSPMLLTQGDRPLFCIGGAGGRTIQGNVAHMIVRVVDRGETLEDAMDAPRFHIETAEPVLVEEGGDAIAAGLGKLGHQVKMRPRFGSLQAIYFDGDGSMTGVADKRRAGTIRFE